MSGITKATTETAGLPADQLQFATPLKPVAAGIAAGYSSVEQSEPRVQQSDDGEPSADRWFETEEIPDIRFCALLDSILPECVVDYLEQLCMSIYNSLFRRSETAPIQRADSATLDLSDDEDRGGASGAQKPKTPKQAAVEKLLEPLSSYAVEDAPEPMPEIRNEQDADAFLDSLLVKVRSLRKEADRQGQMLDEANQKDSQSPVDASQVVRRRQKLDIQAYVKAVEGDLITVSQGRMFRFKSALDPNHWSEGDKVRIWQPSARSTDCRIRNFTNALTNEALVAPVRVQDLAKRK